MNAKELVAANIRYRRRSLRWTQSDAATQMKVAQQTWQSYESGRVSIGVELLSEIAKVLQTTMAALVSVESETVGVTYTETKEGIKRPFRRSARRARK